jgi:hypothetical protein
MTACPHCGGALKGGKPRSIDQHRRFFKVVAQAFHHWPANHDFQPDNAEHLRKWLLVKVGHRIVQTIDMARTDKQSLKMAEAAATAAMRALGDYCWVIPHNGKLFVAAAKSIAFDKCPHADFVAINDLVDGLIETETGIKTDQLLEIAA